MLRGSRQLVTRKSGVSPACYEDVTRKLTTFRPSRHVQMVWRVANFLITIVANLLRGSRRRRQQVREEVTGKLVPVEFELYSVEWRQVKSTNTIHMVNTLPSDSSDSVSGLVRRFFLSRTGSVASTCCLHRSYNRSSYAFICFATVRYLARDYK